MLTWLAIFVSVLAYGSDVRNTGVTAAVFFIMAAAVYAALFLLPILGVTYATIATSTFIFRKARLGSECPRWLITTLTVIPAATLLFVLHVDRFVFNLYGFHLNGFVWNLVFTRGGMESLGGGTDTTIRFTLAAVGFVVLQLILLMLSWRFARDRRTTADSQALRAPTHKARWLLIAGFAVAAIMTQSIYAWACIRGHAPVIAASGMVPMFIPISFTRLAGRWGADIERDEDGALEVKTSLRVRYPLRAITRDESVRSPNIVWLVSESLRADMLDPEIMPSTWALAGRAGHFLNHYSGSNGTRMGMFSMFYGLYGHYWFSFLAERRGPVIMDVLHELNYQMELFTSATFTYPEFDKTIFARVDATRLNEIMAEPRWRRDLLHVDSIVKFIQQRDTGRPFMTFMFFESPHARYYFPAETAIRTPYAQNFDYATMDVANDMPLIKNRYINACHYLDIQIARILQCLTDERLMEDTIVLITGDHGEEFMEKGRWGHNSAFTEEQTRVPLLLWVPGRAASRVTRMTSHLDLPATLLPLLGVTNPPADYSLGFDLFGDVARSFTVLGDWNEIAIFTGDMKAAFQVSGFGVAPAHFTTADDAPITDRNAFQSRHRSTMVRVMGELRTFTQ